MATLHVDSSARQVAARLLRDFLNGRISNMEMDRSFPECTRDAAIYAVYQRMFGYLDDIREFHAIGSYAVQGLERQALDRCVLFLETRLPYEWAPPLVDVLRRACGLLMGIPKQIGDRSVWPFFRRADLASAQKSAQGTDSTATEREEH